MNDLTLYLFVLCLILLLCNIYLQRTNKRLREKLNQHSEKAEWIDITVETFKD